MRALRWSLIALLATSGCFGSKTSEFDEARARARQTEDAGTEPSTSSSSLMSGLGGNPLGGLSNLLSSSLEEPGPYEDPLESDGFDDDEPHLAILTLEGSVVEMQSMSWWGGTSGTELRTIARRVRELAGEDEIRAVMVRFRDLSLSMATAEELRTHLLALAAEGQRSIACYAEQATMLTYYLMSACDRVAMPLNGSLFIGGVGAAPMHLRGLLDRFGVVPDFLTVGTYKGAAEALTRQAPSPQANETLDGILDTAYSTLVRDLAAARKLDEAVIESRLDQGLYTATDASKAGLIDDVTSYNLFREELAGDGGWKKYRWKERETPGLGQLMSFLGMGLGRPVGDRIAVVYALGNIVDGKGEGVLGARGEIASGALVPAIRAMAADDGVKAVVLRVDSPGGSALASELIAQEVAKLEAKKPVIVSMGSVAASGGYYISADATKIYAQDNTLTGSIGVVGGKLVLGKALARYGIKSYPRSRGKNAMLFSALEPWSPAEKRAVRATMMQVYGAFLNRVSKGREKSLAEVRKVADGRVWTGRAAANNGLVDDIGGLDDAIAEARKLAELDADSTIETYPPKPTLRDLLVSFGQVQAPIDATVVRELASALDPVDARVLLRLIDQALSFQHTRVQTTALIPFVAR